MKTKLTLTIKFIVGSLTFHAEINFVFNDYNYFIFIDWAMITNVLGDQDVALAT